MTKNIKILSGFLLLVTVLFFISQSRQKKYFTNSTNVFSIVMEEVYRFDIEQDTLFISIERKDTTWQIVGDDSLEIRLNRINEIEDKILTIKRESVVSNNPKKWNTFNVDDTLGVKLTFYGYNQETLGAAIFGRSNSEWQRSYVRMVDGSEVYMTNENALNRLQTLPSFWGDKPATPTQVEADSL